MAKPKAETDVVQVDVDESDTNDLPAIDITVIVHTTDNTNEKVLYKSVDYQMLDNIVATVQSALNTVRTSSMLSLASPDGTIYIFNVDNVTCVEIRRS
jgi:hypothetical protein